MDTWVWILGAAGIALGGVSIALIWIWERSTRRAKNEGRQEALGEVHEIYDKKMEEHHERERGISAKYLAARNLLRRSRSLRGGSPKAKKTPGR